MDETAIGALRSRYGAALFRLAMRLSDGDHGRAEDLVQETLIRAWRHPEVFDEDGPVLPWLFTVARRVSVDAWRARQHRPAEVSQETLVHDPAAADATDRVLDAQVIAAAMTRLSRPHRQVITELFFRDLSVAEAAVVLGIPQGTVKSRTYYALRALRMVLEETGPAGPG